MPHGAFKLKVLCESAFLCRLTERWISDEMSALNAIHALSLKPLDGPTKPFFQ
jgi:hypothetical protein